MLTKTDRAKLHAQGKIILRPQFKPRWFIAVYSSNGGWKKFKVDCDFTSQPQCSDFIQALARNDERIMADE
jgi:hypothetical protein